MVEVTIRYCVPCRYQFRAIQDADAILKEFGQRIASLRLVTGDHGVYEVSVDSESVFSLDRAEQFPETRDLLDTIRVRLTPRA